MKKFLLALALYCAIQVNQPSAIALPSTPTTISYQGVLATSTDEVVTDGEYSVTFKLYTTLSGGTEVWTETQTVTTVNGIFNVTLGSIEDITDVEFNGNLYLELTLGGTAMEPRILFTAQPYAFVAKTLGATLPITKGGTGATTIEGARENLQLGALAVEDNISDDLWTGEPLSVAHGGTGVDNLEDFISSLGLGTLSSQDADEVDISGGTGAFTNLSSTNDATLNGVKVGKGGGSVASNTLVGNDAMNATATGANNTAVGYKALQSNTSGAHNTAIGRGALLANTTGSENTALGRNALTTSTEASFNTGLGYFALNATTTGSENTAVGGYSSRTNTTGNYNSSLGYHSLYSNTTGNSNTAIGNIAAAGNTTGSENTAVGIAALEKNTTGNRNTALGHQALYGDGGSTGSNNTAVGSSALYKNTTGEGNIALGYQAGFGPGDENGWSVSDNYATFIGYQASRDLNLANSESLNNVTAIGKNAQVGASNSIVLGGTGVDAVNVGIGTKVPTASLEILKTGGSEDNPTALKIENQSNSNQSYGIDLDVNAGIAIDITKTASDSPALRILSEENSLGSSLTINHQSNATNALEINYSVMNQDNSGLLIGIEDNSGENSPTSDGRGITIQHYTDGDNAKGMYVVMGGNGNDTKGIDINMSGIGAEQKGIYVDLASGYDFAAEDSRMGAAIGINDGIGLMVANTSNDPNNVVKIGTNNNALEVVGSSSITGAITLEDENPFIQGAGDGEFLISSAGDLRFESTGDLTLSPTGNLVIPIASKGAGKVLTSDANGNATWQTASGGGSSALTTTSVTPTNNSGQLSVDLSSTTEDIISVNFNNENDGNNIINVIMPTGTNGDVKYFRFYGVHTSDALTLTGLNMNGFEDITTNVSYTEYSFVAFYLDGAWRTQLFY